MAVIATANADLTATCGYEVTTSGMRLLKADSGQNSHVGWQEETSELLQSEFHPLHLHLQRCLNDQVVLTRDN